MPRLQYFGWIKRPNHATTPEQFRIPDPLSFGEPAPVRDYSVLCDSRLATRLSRRADVEGPEYLQAIGPAVYRQALRQLSWSEKTKRKNTWINLNLFAGVSIEDFRL